ncbi:hypothetical protein B0H13DRAFT_1861362 [Mycena leptocephala]|nr:hypothetical protein B0H13DRAFT_1861362 [Mycena leptocephala]
MSFVVPKICAAFAMLIIWFILYTHLALYIGPKVYGKRNTRVHDNRSALYSGLQSDRKRNANVDALLFTVFVIWFHGTPMLKWKAKGSKMVKDVLCIVDPNSMRSKMRKFHLQHLWIPRRTATNYKIIIGLNYIGRGTLEYMAVWLMGTHHGGGVSWGFCLPPHMFPDQDDVD